MTLWLYWCTTPGGESDYWVVAENAVTARDYFADETGFQYNEVRAERIRKRIPQENPPGEVSIPKNIPSFPTKSLLTKWGVSYSSRFHVFWIGKRIFRPESTTRALMISVAVAAQRRRRQALGPLSKTVFSL